MEMAEKVAAFKAAQTWLWPGYGCPVHSDADLCAPAVESGVMQARHFQARMVVAGVCRGEHAWQLHSDGQIEALTDHIRTVYRCERHPQHPVWRIERRPLTRPPSRRP
jgi:hypothetical protein